MRDSVGEVQLIVEDHEIPIVVLSGDHRRVIQSGPSTNEEPGHDMLKPISVDAEGPPHIILFIVNSICFRGSRGASEALLGCCLSVVIEAKATFFLDFGPS